MIQQGSGKEISVVVLSYNHAHLIESALQSVLQQSLPEVEVIVSDDCSTDRTWEILVGMSRKHSSLQIIRTPKNLGMPGNANFAVQQVTRPYIALLHHDDLCRPDLLEQWLSLFLQEPQLVFSFNAYKIFGTDKIYAEPLSSGSLSGETFLSRYLLPRWDCPVRGTAMIRRTAWQQAGGMREQFGLLADIDLWMRLSRQGRVGYIAEPLITVRQDRPEGYPDEYKEGQWSWKRQRILYTIHAQNRLMGLTSHSLRSFVSWNYFRYRLNKETFKWLLYALIRGKSKMRSELMDSATPYDYWWLRIFRRLVHSVFNSSTPATALTKIYK
ncbi:MAG: glycosyltransferase family 2 protein [Chitinophagaceae bacterium]